MPEGIGSAFLNVGKLRFRIPALNDRAPSDRESMQAELVANPASGLEAAFGAFQNLEVEKLTFSMFVKYLFFLMLLFYQPEVLKI